MSIISSNSANLASVLLPKFLLCGFGVCVVETQKCTSDILCQQMCNVHGKPYNSSNTFVKDLVDLAAREGRKVYGLDCLTIVSKYDAIGWLRALSELPREDQRPIIVVIENITELNAKELQYALIHAWKNEKNVFLNDRQGQNDTFSLNNKDYLVYLTSDLGYHDELLKILHPGDGFAWIGNYEVWKNSILETNNISTL